MQQRSPTTPKLFKDSQDSQNLISWEDKFIKEGFSKELITYLLKTKAIKDWKNLYQTTMSLPPSIREDIQQPWELFCLSGETAAFDYGVDEAIYVEEPSKENGMQKRTEDLRMNAQTVGKWTMNPLHYAALSGRPEQVDKAVELGIDVFQPSHRGINVLHYAALSGSSKQMEKILSLETTEKQFSRVDNKGRSVLHYAAASGSLDAVKKALELVNPDVKDGYDSNALDYANTLGHTDISDYLQKVYNLQSSNPSVSFGAPRPVYNNLCFPN